MNSRLSVTFPPHIQETPSISSMTYGTIAALCPAVLVSLYYYGLRALFVMVLSVLTAVVVEAWTQKLMHQKITVYNGTAALTGLLLAMLLPVGAPWWAVIVGAAVAIFLGRQVFGGFGGNPFNAVLVGWIVLRLSWPDAVNTYFEITPLFEGLGSLTPVDATELPLGLMQYGDSGSVMALYEWWPSLIGSIPGGIGSTSVIALLLGGLILVYKRIVPWQIPTGFLGGLFVFSLIFWLFDAEGATYANPVYQVIFGYSIIGAFFLAPDVNTSPFTPIGMLVFGAGAGILTMIIRYWGSYDDGVFFAIMFFNALTPVLDRIKTKSYGTVKE